MTQTLKTENINNFLEEKEKEIKTYVETEMNLLKFELALGSIPKKEREQATKVIKEYREKKWNKALGLAKGNERKAEEIYDKI